MTKKVPLVFNKVYETNNLKITLDIFFKLAENSVCITSLDHTKQLLSRIHLYLEEKLYILFILPNNRQLLIPAFVLFLVSQLPLLVSVEPSICYQLVM